MHRRISVLTIATGARRCALVIRASLVSVALSCGALVGLLHAGTMYPSDYDQYMLELVNRARANPLAEAERYGITLNEGIGGSLISSAPKQPLAFEPHLMEAATRHSQYLLDTDQFIHEGPGGNSVGDRARAAGYSEQSPWGMGENLAWYGQTLGVPDMRFTIDRQHQNLFVDSTIEGRWHRINMLRPEFREAGIGVLTGTYGIYNSVMTTENFAYSGTSPLLTGVVFRDQDRDGFYSPGGEGLAGVIVTATQVGSTLSFQTTTFGSGGYSLNVAPGEYQVTFEQSGLGQVVREGIVVGANNVKLDLIDDEVPYWQNPVVPTDVDGNQQLQPLDVLVLINELNQGGSRTLITPDGGATPPPFLDVNGDESLTPLDVLVVINALNAPPDVMPSLPLGAITVLEVLPVHVPEPSTLLSATIGVGSLLIFAARRRSAIERQ